MLNYNSVCLVIALQRLTMRCGKAWEISFDSIRQKIVFPFPRIENKFTFFQNSCYLGTSNLFLAIQLRPKFSRNTLSGRVSSQRELHYSIVRQIFPIDIFISHAVKCNLPWLRIVTNMKTKLFLCFPSKSAH